MATQALSTLDARTLPVTAEPAGTAGEAASPRDGPTSSAPLQTEAPLAARLDPPGRRPEMRAVSDCQWSLRVTIDRACKEDLETLSMLLSHKVPRGDLAAVLHEAIRCGIEKHGKRKGAVRPARKVAPRTAAPKNQAAIPAEVRRQVWERDGGRCSWIGPDGRRCDSRWQVEVDHIDAAGRGGTATLENLRLACREHNLLHAERVYGREFMERYRKNESTTAGADHRSLLSRAIQPSSMSSSDS